MAQPVTALLCPEPDDNPEMPACPAFCDGTCVEWNDEDGAGHHTSGFRLVTASNGDFGKPVEWVISTSRTDEDFAAGDTDVNLIAEHGSSASMTPAEARQLAALLLDVADLADPMPLGTLPASARDLRLGDELLTADGWQTVTGLMFFASSQVAIFTNERNDEDSDGWPFEPTDPVRIRRRIHGSCVLPFEEPLS